MTVDDTLPRSRDHALVAAVDATVEDEVTGARWVHKDLVQVKEAWADEMHISPPKANEHFGDVESWAAYVKQFAGAPAPFLSWNSTGLHAVLDYHQNADSAGRLQWTAHYPFTPSIEWKAWTALASGQAVAQRQAIEKLEDLADNIIDPPPTELMALLRTLRATVNKSAQTELRPDGTTAVSWNDDKTVSARGGVADLPPEFTIAIPILRGHVDAGGKPVVYSLKVKLRASVDDQARLALRFSIPSAEKALEEVYADRVRSARALLGDGLNVLRAGG